MVIFQLIVVYSKLILIFVFVKFSRYHYVDSSYLLKHNTVSLQKMGINLTDGVIVAVLHEMYPSINFLLTWLCGNFCY